jgi:hypothetical protein
VSTGIFAVGSIMVGKVVSNSDCSLQTLNITANINHVTAATESPSRFDQVKQCRVGVATALTFMVGIYQAGSLNKLLNTSEYLRFEFICNLLALIDHLQLKVCFAVTEISILCSFCIQFTG